MHDQRRDAPPAGRRLMDDMRYWLPIILSLMTTLVAIGSLYGHIGGKLELIEWRLTNIEKQLGSGTPR